MLLCERMIASDVFRLLAVSHTLCNVISGDDAFWASLHVRVGLALRNASRTLKGREAFVCHMKKSRSTRCRQCAKKTRARAMLPSGNTIMLCGKCTVDGYAMLMSRRDVIRHVCTIKANAFDSLLLPWRKIKARRTCKLLFAALTVAKMNAKGAHLYWPSQVKAALTQIAA